MTAEHGSKKKGSCVKIRVFRRHLNEFIPNIKLFSFSLSPSSSSALPKKQKIAINEIQRSHAPQRRF